MRSALLDDNAGRRIFALSIKRDVRLAMTLTPSTTVLVRRGFAAACTLVGVVGVICPWNGSFAAATLALAPLCAGNSVIMKPAEQSTIVGAKLMECLMAAKVPPGVANFLPGIGEEIGEPKGAGLIEI